MKHRRLVPLCPLLLFCLAGGCSGTVETGTGQARNLPRLSAVRLPRALSAPSRYTFRASPGVVEEAQAKAPMEMMVYEVVRDAPTRDTAGGLAERLGRTISESRYKGLPSASTDGRQYTVTLGGEDTASDLGDLDVTVLDNGNYLLAFRVPPPTSTDQAPSDDEALALAEEFLDRTGLLPEGCELLGVQEGDYIEYTDPDREGIQKQVISKSVLYTRYRDGIQDGVFAVRVNGGGVHGVLRNMRNTKPLASYPILSPSEAVAALKAGDGVIDGPPSADETVEATIEAVDLEYYEGAAGWGLDTVQPVYRFSGSVEGQSKGFTAQVPAVRPEYLAEEEATPKPMSRGG